jgi:hypothetical protein
MPDTQISELALSRIWQAGRVAREMRTTSGARVHVIYPGVWTHADGPDFRDALIDISGILVRGSVELHLRASDWHRHGHDTNASYDEVVLHVVLDNDLDEPVRQPGDRSIPTLELRHYLTGDLSDPARSSDDESLGALGRFTCLPTLAGGRADMIRATLRREGWKRLSEKQLRFCQDFEWLSPADVLFRGLLDGLGLTRNRAGMALVADRLSLVLVESSLLEYGPDGPAALLLGSGGFLPLSAATAAIAGIDAHETDRLAEIFDVVSAGAGIKPVPVSVWNVHRVRPMNHPVRRLMSLASLVHRSAPDGLLDMSLNFDADRADPWRDWLTSASPTIGSSRAMQLASNVLAPFIAAYAQISGNTLLEERAGVLWEWLPGRADDATSRSTLEQIAGNQRLSITLAIETQGLHHIGRHGCQHLRCFECPIAALAMTYERPGL